MTLKSETSINLNVHTCAAELFVSIFHSFNAGIAITQFPATNDITIYDK